MPRVELNRLIRHKYAYKKGHKRWWAALLVGLAIIFIELLIQLNPAFAATFADNVLRPVIGGGATIAIENFFFTLSDYVKQVEYHTIAKPNANIYTTEPIKKPSSSVLKLQSLSLQSIALRQSTYSPLPGEGQWNLVSLPQFLGQPVMARTFVRPDPARSYAIVAVVQMNTRLLQLHAVAGTQQPGGPIGHPGSGVIPYSIQQGKTLVAAFNGGFQYKDGEYGMTVGSTTYVPLKVGMGTLTIHQNGLLTIGRYSPPTKADPTISAVRQNGPLIVDKGAVSPDTLSGGVQVWGLTTTNSSYTWRSGIGITKTGNLLYAVGPSLDAQTLAIALKAAGAVEAMQLDINPFWVRFVMFQPSTSTNEGYGYQSLLSSMQDGGYGYLHEYNKDFFYLTLK